MERKMSQYEFARIEGFTGVSGHIVCTNDAEMENLLKDLQTLSPKLQIGALDHQQHQVTIANPELVAVRFWIVNWLCVHGWEPYSHFEDIYDFRRASEH
jgi:hypothetical protein